MVGSPVPHTTIARRAEHDETVRGSRFLAVVAPVDAVADARRLLAELRRRHPEASHHCSAWRVGAELAFDDDGEPGGTAGRPMSSVLLKRDLDHVAAVCVRWFGGTRLGAGGLVRAYSGATSRALDAAGTRVVHDTVRAVAHAPFPRADALHRLLDGWRHLSKGEPTYDAEGVQVPLRLRADDAAAFERALVDATAGDARLEVEAPSDAGPS